MKIELPHRTLTLTEENKMLPCEDKVALVNSILQEEVEDGVSLELYLHNSFDNQKSIVILDMLGYFITKIHRERQDIMTRETIGKMQRGDGRTTPFTSLKNSDKLNLGLIDANDCNYD